MQRYFGIKKDNNYLYLLDSDYHHIKNVMRNSDGDLIEVVVDGKLYLGCIENVNKNISIILKKEIDNEDEYIPKVNLIIPLLKENKMDLILQKSTEMGVNKIIVFPFKRCVVKADKKKIKSKIERWMRILKEASEQSKRTTIPEVFYEDNINNLKKDKSVNIVCSTQKNLNNVKRVLTENRNCDTINIVIGPEGGLDISEEKKLNEIGFVSTTLGNRIMRVESVPLFVLSIINYEFME